MEVLLKKTKITKSILEQSLFGHASLYIGHPNYDTLGWCRVKVGRNMRDYILIYCRATQVILKLNKYSTYSINEVIGSQQMAREGTVNDWYFPLVYILKLDNTIIFRTLEEKVFNESKVKLQKFLREVEQKGQIYI